MKNLHDNWSVRLGENSSDQTRKHLAAVLPKLQSFFRLHAFEYIFNCTT